MSDQFSEISARGYGSRLGGSIVAALFGFLLLPVSVGLLYWNEGRAVEAATALDRGASTVVEISADHPDPSAEGKLVHVTGTMAAATSAKDPLFGVAGQDLIRLRRSVEMYQWQEEKHSESQQSVGGTKTTETTYTYRRSWVDRPVDSASFKHPEGHFNPAMPVHDQTFDGGKVTLGAYRLGEPVLAQLSSFQPVTPDAAVPPPAGYRLEGDALFHGAGSLAGPAIGDVKVSFAGVGAGPVSVVAGLSGGTLDAFHDKTGYELVMAEPGTASAEALFHAKKSQEGNLTWILRGVGTLVMLIAFLLVGGPVSMLLAFLPFLEGIAEAGVFLIALTLTFPLALLTIALAWFAHRPLIGIGLIAAAVVWFVFLRRMHSRPAAATAASAGP